MHKMFSIAEVQTKVINCNSANKSYLLQILHTKAIAALTQFCDFLIDKRPDFLHQTASKILGKVYTIEI